MNRNQRIGTIIKIIASQPSITMSKLHAELLMRGVAITERTLAKDIALLKNDYELLPKKERLRSGYVLDGIQSLSAQESDLVLDALQVFAIRLGDSDADTLFERLHARKRDVYKDPGHRLRTIRQRNIYPKPARQVHNTLIAAIREHQAILFSYRTPRLRQQQEVRGYPLLLVFHERGWYCIIRDVKKKSYSAKRLDRIRSCSILRSTPLNEEHQAELQEAEFLMSCGWGMSFPNTSEELAKLETEPPIKVRFDRTVASFIMESVERHPRGRVVPLRDGTGDIEFHIKLATPDEFVFWVRSFGRKAWIVAPRALVERERREIRDMLDRYTHYP